ncbi:TetR/AcrR family transcriptional regulator [Umezawaea beigongshangensis]|uniref:TetR/AcrR family transcriptional regulator n=1 Tax=Umezawaea beigongshangensis TaxID=2780383 RepID=UPI0018F10B31|nr:TetR/AcrR family transcriptional regulator [Umezawaea beigongshangensis]
MTPVVESTLHPRERLLRTASRLFYAEGVHTVGVDRLVTEAGITRATFYRHFPSKEDLVEAYLRARSEGIRRAVDAITGTSGGRAALLSVVDLIGDDTCRQDFRGCAFLNAAAEYPDPAHQVRVAIAEHRAWFSGVLRDLLAGAGHPEPDHAARVLVLLRDGALQSGELDDPQVVRETLLRAVHDLLGTGRAA